MSRSIILDTGVLIAFLMPKDKISVIMPDL
jgi:hypothetical protein